MRRAGKRKRSKIKMWESQEGDAVERVDPIECLGNDLALHILRHIEPRYLLNAALVCKRWHALATSDAVWQPVCEILWEGKSYVPAKGLDLPTWKERYLRSDYERKRKKISFTELTTFEWRFRFKRTAGAWWAQIDPYWVHNKDESRMMRRRFAVDGTFQAIGQNDPLMDPHMAMSWRFVGDGVQVEEFPVLQCSRTRDWGFVLENQWVIFKADLPLNGPHSSGVKPAF
jgi:hypothetical protein